MAMVLGEAQPSVRDLLTDGIAKIDSELDKQFDSDQPDSALVMSLNGLRSRYVFDKMRVIRAQIIANDQAAETDGVLANLEKATQALKDIQDRNAVTIRWITEAADAVDAVYGLFGKLAKL